MGARAHHAGPIIGKGEIGRDGVRLTIVPVARLTGRANLSKAERNELAAILPRIAAPYRERRKK